MAYHNNPRIVTDGLLLCYDMNNPRCYPGTGTTIYNLADSTNYPSMYPHTSDSANLAYIDFVTTNPGYVELTKGTTASVNTEGNFLRGTGGIRGTLDSNFTTMGWMLRTSNSKATILSYRHDGRRLEFIVTSSTMEFRQRQTVSPYTTNTTSVNVTNSLNVWDHYALVKIGIGAQATSSWKFYKNGSLLATNSFAMDETMSSGGSYYHIGAAWSDDDYIVNAMGGYIGPVYHYTTSLSDAQVLQNYNALKARFGK